MAEYLNAGDFWSLYKSEPGHVRRDALLAHFKATPGGRLPVNCKWQASTRDKDLAYLMKKGILVQTRDGGGGSHHPMNKSSRKRQSYLILAKEHGGQVEPIEPVACEVLKIRMKPAMQTPGWASSLDRKGARAGSRSAPFGRTHWFVKRDGEGFEVVQCVNTAYTTTVENPTPAQLKLAALLVEVGVATLIGRPAC